MRTGTQVASVNGRRPALVLTSLLLGVLLVLVLGGVVSRLLGVLVLVLQSVQLLLLLLEICRVFVRGIV